MTCRRGKLARFGAVFVLGVAAIFPIPAPAAEPWPTRPIRLVVPFSAAGAADLLARMTAERVGAALGQPIVVEHRPGAGGIIGQEQVARAAPDGYTFVVSSLGSFVINPVFSPVGFDPFRDFTHIAYLGGQPVVLIANKTLPYRTLGELITYAKANPGALNYATIGTGSQTHLFSEMMQKQAGIKMTHVPYRGAGQIVTDVLGGHIATGALALQAATGSIAAGTVHGLAVSSEARIAAYPDLPTYKEQGYPELVSATWFALSGPTGLAADIVQRLNAEVVKALHAPDLQARLAREAIDTKRLDVAAFNAFYRMEAERWTPIARAVAADVKAAGTPR